MRPKSSITIADMFIFLIKISSSVCISNWSCDHSNPDGIGFLSETKVVPVFYFLGISFVVSFWKSMDILQSGPFTGMAISCHTHQGINAAAIVVLGGGTESAMAPRTDVEVNSAGDRLIHAADLYHEGAAPLLILSGGKIDWMESIENSPASDMRKIMLKLGVPDDALILQPKSRNTYEDALYSAELLKEKGIKNIILVTSAMHMPRSVALFKKQGLEVIPSPTDFTVTEDGWKRAFSPNLETFIDQFVAQFECAWD